MLKSDRSVCDSHTTYCLILCGIQNTAKYADSFSKMSGVFKDAMCLRITMLNVSFYISFFVSYAYFFVVCFLGGLAFLCVCNNKSRIRKIL